MKNSSFQFGSKSLLGVTLLVAVFFAGRWSMIERVRQAERESERLADQLLEIVGQTPYVEVLGGYIVKGNRQEVERRRRAIEVLTEMGKLPRPGEAEPAKSPSTEERVFRELLGDDRGKSGEDDQSSDPPVGSKPR